MQTKVSKNLYFAILLILYPFIVYFGFNYFEKQSTAFIVCLLLSIRLFISFKSNQLITKVLNVAIVITLILSLAGFFLKKVGFVKLYPVCVSLSLLVYFFLSLFSERIPVVERLARIKEKDLPGEAIQYTRKLTAAWCIVFLVNASISYYTFLFSNNEIWTLYNGFVSYILLGVFAGLEYLIRIRLKKKWGHQ